MRHYSATTGLHAPPVWRAPEGPADQTAAPVGGGGAWPGFEMTRRATSATTLHWCGGRRRVRRARAGFEIDHSERSSRVAISRAAGPEGAQNTSGATRNATRQAEPQATKHPGNHATQTRGSPTGRRAFTQLVHTLDTVERPSTQRSRAATTSATWTALRAAPLRRLSPETTRTRPRLPSTA